jgi:hypothetical protein
MTVTLTITAWTTTAIWNLTTLLVWSKLNPRIYYFWHGRENCEITDTFKDVTQISGFSQRCSWRFNTTMRHGTVGPRRFKEIIAFILKCHWVIKSDSTIQWPLKMKAVIPPKLRHPPTKTHSIRAQKTTIWKTSGWKRPQWHVLHFASCKLNCINVKLKLYMCKHPLIAYYIVLHVKVNVSS